MKRSHLVVTALMPMSLLGCSALRFNVTGVVCKSLPRFKHTFMNFADVRRNVPIETEQVVKLKVRQRILWNHYDYNVLLGALEHPANIAIGKLTRYKLIPTFHLDQGWAFLWTNPSVAVAKSEWVIGATCGSTMVVEVAQENQERVERVYCLEGEDVKVTCLIGSSSTFPLKPGEYVQIEKENNDCNFNGPYEITGSALERFITELKEIAETAGWK